MPVFNLDRIFKPRSVAVIGASDEPTKVGCTVLRNLREAGFSGAVYPVNPKREQVQGLRAFARIQDLPQPPDLAIICTPAAGVPGLIGECGQAGIRGVIILSAGFREVGPAGKELEAAVRREAARFDGLRIVGPNCLGVIVPGIKLNASFASATPPAGRVAFVSQSGALCTSLLDWAIEEHVGFSHFVSVGNMLDVGVGDLIDYFAMDPATDSIVLYVESIDEARHFMSAARAFTQRKPIVAYKAGRFTASAKAAASHTGAMAGVDAVYEAAFQRAGIVRVFNVDDLFDCAELLSRQRIPKHPRLAIMTNAGGPGVMATDALLARGGELAALRASTVEALNACLPPFWSHGNPIDILGDATPERFGQALDCLLVDDQVDAVMVILTPQAMTDPTATAGRVVRAARTSSKPVLAVWMGGKTVRPGLDELNRGDVPSYATPEHAVRAFMYLVEYARNRETLYETPRDLPPGISLDRARSRDCFARILAQGQALVSEENTKALLDAYGIPVTVPRRAASASQAVDVARGMGYPVVLKVDSPQITHKTEVDGVALNISSDEQVQAAFERIVASARGKRPDARVDGVTVQPMVVAAHSVELIFGAKQDPIFGPVIMAGLGGITAELWQDRALGLPPLSERLARRMLESLKSWVLLQGHRGRAPVQVDKLIEVLLRLSYLVADFPEIQELDVNPILATSDGVLALDARMLIDCQPPRHPRRPFAHLAIHPYPEKYIRRMRLKDGLEVLLRPIRPEDEPLWRALVASCSTESLWSRFRYVFKEPTHDMAARFCFIDYDRELAIVAEVEHEQHRKLVGVGRLVADPDHREAEYAVLVADACQGQGLGSVLTDYCLEVARDWQLRSVVAETTPTNSRMLHVFSKRGFALDYKVAPDVVLARKNLSDAAGHDNAAPGVT